MIASEVPSTEFVAVDSDDRILGDCRAAQKVRIGRRLTRGLGAGARLNVGRRAITENLTDVVQAIDGVGLVILTGGLGGGTGSGAMPVLASTAMSLGAKVVVVVTMPVLEEGRKRERQAKAALADLYQSVKKVEVVPSISGRGSTWPLDRRNSIPEVANHVLGIHHAWIVDESSI